MACSVASFADLSAVAHRTGVAHNDSQNECLRSGADMTEIYLMSVTGAVGGVIGSVLGLGSAWVAHRASRRSLELKALELRLEIRKAINALNHGNKRLEDQLNLAFRSRTRVAAAAGVLKSGEMVNWRAQFDTDSADLNDLKHALEVLSQDFGGRSTHDLEALLADLDAQAYHVKALLGRYRDSVAADDKAREQAMAKAGPMLVAATAPPRT